MSLDRDKIKKKKISSTRKSGVTRSSRSSSNKVSGNRTTTTKTGTKTKSEKRVVSRSEKPTLRKIGGKKSQSKTLRQKPKTKLKAERATKVAKTPKVPKAPKTPKQPKPPRKIKFPKLNRKNAKKEKGRLHRSIKERSILPLLVLLLLIGGGVGFTYWYNGEAANRLVKSLKSFDIPEDIDFKPRDHHILIPLLRHGEDCVPVLIKNYPTMKNNEKIATIALLRHFPKEENMEILSKALVDKDEKISYLAAIATSKIKDPAIASIQEMMQDKSLEKQYIISALGQMKTTNAFDILMKEIVKESLSKKLKIYMIDALGNFKREEAIIGIINAGLDHDEKVGKKATSILNTERENGLLDPYSKNLVEIVESKFIESEDAIERARLIDIIGVVSKCTKASGDNYISNFRVSIRRSLSSEHEEEKAAAARTLGIFGDDAYTDRLFALLKSDSSLVADSATQALIQIGDSEIPIKVLEKSMTRSSDKKMVIIASQLLDEYYLYLLKAEKTQETVNQIFQVLQRSKEKSIQSAYLDLLFKYTELSPFKMSSKNAKILMKFALVAPAPTKKEENDETISPLNRREKLFIVMGRYLKGNAKDQIVKTFISALTQMDNDGKERMHASLLEYRKKRRAYHQTKKISKSSEWTTWFKAYLLVEEKIKNAELLIVKARKLMEKKKTSDLEKAQKILTSAKKIYQNIEETTTFGFQKKIQEIQTLLYESKKARGIK